MNQTETALARIFAICDEVAETGKPLLTESEGRNDARSWLGSAAACSPYLGGHEPEQEKCGTTHYAGCACHEKGWQNKWECAVEMAARAEAKLDLLTAALKRIEEIYCDGENTHDDWRAMGEIARAALISLNASDQATASD